MYYPYLRGRQNELIALRNFAENLKEESKVFPIIEPVRMNKSGLKRAAITMTEKGVKYAIILNPENGECANTIINFSNELDFPSLENWSPAFIVGKMSLYEIGTLIRDNGYKNVMLILPKGMPTDEDQLVELIKEEAVTKVVTDPTRRKIVRETKNFEKELIELDDKFEAKKTNLDYVEIDEELFTEEFAYYLEDGFAGFSDYTVLPNDFREGGTLPKVVVIHLTYQKKKDQIFVKHFCSDSNREDKSNIQGKFEEAAKKAIAFFDEIDYDSISIKNLRDNIEERRFPGLGVVKKISILHHIDLMQRIL
jgi:hypothetical protein